MPSSSSEGRADGQIEGCDVELLAERTLKVIINVDGVILEGRGLIVLRIWPCARQRDEGSIGFRKI